MGAVLRAETDQEKRKALYWEAQALLQDDGGAVVAMWANFIHANNKSLAHDDAVAANWRSDGGKVAERVLQREADSKSDRTEHGDE